jgi:hypothetical protein
MLRISSFDRDLSRGEPTGGLRVRYCGATSKHQMLAEHRVSGSQACYIRYVAEDELLEGQNFRCAVLSIWD